ncbi:lipid droplet phospholipase 1 [Diutina catenulata]
MSTGANVVSTSSSEASISVQENGHLFVLIHGLWGSPNHMITIEKCLQNLLPNTTKDKICTLRPSSFSFWKTYDGIVYNAERVIEEILYEIEALKEKEMTTVSKISIVGYSLGGLISRCVIGLLFEMGFFDTVKPIIFTTFATPHVGVEFFKENLFDFTANRLGQYMFGKTGKELFVKDTNQMLVEMADPGKRYFKGLMMFQLKIILSNVKNDRTVPFYTSFITEYSPFDEWKHVHIKYIKGLPEATIGRKTVRPKFVDLRRTRILAPEDAEDFIGNVQEETSVIRKHPLLRFASLVLIVCVFLPVWIPTVLVTTLWVSLYSVTKTRLLSPINYGSHWIKVSKSVYGSDAIDEGDVAQGVANRQERRRLSRSDSFKGDTSEITENTMEGIMYANEKFSGATMDDITEESDNGDETVFTLGEIDVRTNDAVVESCIDVLRTQQKDFPMFTETCKLRLSQSKIDIIRNLNSLDWIKIPVYIDAWNAHDGIVARRGPKTNPKGTSTIGLWCSILRLHLRKGEPTSK